MNEIAQHKIKIYEFPEVEEEEEMKGTDRIGDGSSVKFCCYFRFGDAQRTK